MQKQKSIFNHPLELERLILGIRKTIGHQPKKTRTMPIGKTGTETKIKLSLITSHLLTINFRFRPPGKTNVIKAIEEAIQPLGSMLLRWPKKIKIKPSTWAISSVILTSRRDIMPTSAPKSQKKVAVLATSTLMTKKIEEVLEQISYIWYLVTFKN